MILEMEKLNINNFKKCLKESEQLNYLDLLTNLIFKFNFLIFLNITKNQFMTFFFHDFFTIFFIIFQFSLRMDLLYIK